MEAPPDDVEGAEAPDDVEGTRALGNLTGPEEAFEARNAAVRRRKSFFTSSFVRNVIGGGRGGFLGA